MLSSVTRAVVGEKMLSTACEGVVHFGGDLFFMHVLTGGSAFSGLN